MVADSPIAAGWTSSINFITTNPSPVKEPR